MECYNSIDKQLPIGLEVSDGKITISKIVHVVKFILVLFEPRLNFYGVFTSSHVTFYTVRHDVLTTTDSRSPQYSIMLIYARGNVTRYTRVLSRRHTLR